MPCLSGQYDKDVGILLQVGLVPGGRIEDLRQHANVSDDMHTEFVASGAHGLVDTGASKTSISPHIAADLALEPRGIVEIQGATGSTKSIRTMSISS